MKARRTTTTTTAHWVTVTFDPAEADQVRRLLADVTHRGDWVLDKVRIRFHNMLASALGDPPGEGIEHHADARS